MQPTDINYDDLKKRGFLRQKQEGFFVLRTRMSQGVYSQEQLRKLAEISKEYGRGFAHATTRQGLEIPFIRLDDIPKVEKEITEAGILLGTSGPRLRPTTCCPGNNWCKMGLVNTFAFYDRIEKELNLPCATDLPHKFKIAISGCPNSCTRPQHSEIGLHGAVDVSRPDKRIGYAAYFGGCGGRTPRSGLKSEKIYSEDEALGFIERVVQFYKKNAKPRQRLGALIEEVGKEKALAAILP